MVVAVNGYVNVAGAFAGWFPPGVYSFPAAVRVVRNLAKANALAYDAVHRHDRRARVGPVQNMIAFTPADPASASDRRGAEHADYVFNRVFLNAAVKGWDDRDVDGRIEAGERRRDLRGRADFIGVNYYFRSRVTGLPGPASSTVALFDFLPTNTYRYPQQPDRPALPDDLHRLRRGGLPAGLPRRAAHGRQLRPAGVRDRERAGRRRRRHAPRVPARPPARAARRDARPASRA